MDLLEAIESDDAVQLKALNLPARAIPDVSLPEGYRTATLSSEVIEILAHRFDLQPWIEEGLGLYLWAWRHVDPVLNLHSWAMDRLTRRTAEEDAITAMGLLNLGTSVPVAVVGEIWLSDSLATAEIDDVSAGIGEDGEYPSSAHQYWQPEEMHPHFGRTVSELARIHRGLSSDADCAKRMAVALRQWTLANAELSAVVSSEAWLADPLVRLMVTLEALLGERSLDQLTRALRQRGALLSGPAPGDAIRADRAINRCYSLRSSYVHGGDRRPTDEELALARDAVGTVLRNWLVVMNDWTEGGGSAKTFLQSLDECLLNPPTLHRIVAEPLRAFEERIGPVIEGPANS